MMCRTQEVLASLKSNKSHSRAFTSSHTIHRSIKYSLTDISKAKIVLDKLMRLPDRNDISYIRVIPREVNEV